MNVYTYFDDSEHAPINQGHMIRIWAKSWAARGWKPRIMTIRNASKHHDFEKLKHDHRQLPFLAFYMAAPKGGLFSESSVINFSLTPAGYKKRGVAVPVTYLARGWETATLVEFENCHDVSLIKHCGRAL